MFIKTILEHITYSNFIVSIACGILSWGTCSYFLFEHAAEYGLFSGLVTFCIYNFQRLVKHRIYTNESKHIAWVSRFYYLIILTVVASGIGSILLFFQLFRWNILTLAGGSLVALISVAYIIRIRKSNLRELPYLKIYLIAFCWVFTTSLFPLINEANFNVTYWAIAIVQLLYIIAVTIPFDLRDMYMDNSDQKTIPQLVGTTNAKIISCALLILFLLTTAGWIENLSHFYWFLLAVLIQILFVIFSSPNRASFYFALIDGSISLLGLSYYFLR